MLAGSAATLLATGALQAGEAQPASPSEPFDFASLTERMKRLAQAPYVPAKPSPRGPELDYDGYRAVQFRPERARWAEDDIGYQVHAYAPGWLYDDLVALYEVVDGQARPLHFSTEDFRYHSATIEQSFSTGELPGVAGFRINYPLNRPEAYDELISFLGASYFRALGRDNVYGVSARGLALNCWLNGPEEFPRFSEFYLVRPQTDDEPLTIYAALEGESVTGAYQFEILPASENAQETMVEVTARLFFRSSVEELGVAPLTSMFLYAEANRSGFDDYRPQVHDSNGLLIERATGEVIWRALNNAETLGNSYFWENNPRAFGLYQRGRDFESYQDAGALYERRPSVRIEPIGDWGQGNVRLIEVPAKLEADDNIVAFWVPSEPVEAGQEREYRYRLVWGDLDGPSSASLAYVAETRGGRGGVSGVENPETLRKFVVDFKGGDLDQFDEGTPPDVLANISAGTVLHSALSRIPANGVWRLVLDVELDSSIRDPVELKAYLVGAGRQLTETWVYQWRALT